MRSVFRSLKIAGPIATALLLLSLPSVSAQQSLQPSGQELVANLAAGRVVIAVVRDAIIVGTVENPIEVETRPPTPVEIESSRLGILLGPVDWFSPSSQQQIAQLDRELPRLKTHLVATAPHLGQSQGGQAPDIEAIGQGLQERLDQVAKGLQSKINLAPDEPFAELILADYLTGYGPELWQLRYEMKQAQQKGDYWDTRVLKPTYLQFWPPEKGQPKTLVEFNYPPENETLLELLRRNDPRVANIRTSDPQMAMVADELVQGNSTKLLSVNVVQFLRAALAAIAPPKSRETMAIIGMEKGFAWVLPPPPEADLAAAQAGQPSDRPADAPSLLKH